jgi:hypothetical protein
LEEATEIRLLLLLTEARRWLALSPVPVRWLVDDACEVLWSCDAGDDANSFPFYEKEENTEVAVTSLAPKK